MAELATSYLGIPLRNPVIAGACTKTSTVAGAQELADQGVGAIVMKSVFEEQIRIDVEESIGALESEYAVHTEVVDYLRAGLPMQLGPKAYLERIGEIKAVLDIPVIASLNCVTSGTWISYAHQLANAGADALELNIYDIVDRAGISGCSLESHQVELVAGICAEVKIPVAVKLGPSYTALPDFVSRLDAVPIQGLVLFNRFLQPDIDLDTMSLVNTVNLSRSETIRLPLRWTAILSNLVNADIALSGGVHAAEGVLKGLAAGATAVQICSVLYEQGASAAGGIVRDMENWLQAHKIASLDEIRGKMAYDPETGRGFERAQYIRSLTGLE